MTENQPDIAVIAALYAAYNSRDLDSWTSSFAADATWTNVPTGETFIGPEGQHDNYAAWNGPFPTGQCVDLHLRGGDGVVVAEFKGDGVNTGPLPSPEGDLPPTNKRVVVSFCDVHEVAGGFVRATRRYWDQAAVAAQLEV